jgi:hypothetical protein
MDEGATRSQQDEALGRVVYHLGDFTYRIRSNVRVRDRVPDFPSKGRKCDRCSDLAAARYCRNVRPYGVPWIQDLCQTCALDHGVKIDFHVIGVYVITVPAEAYL